MDARFVGLVVAALGAQWFVGDAKAAAPTPDEALAGIVGTYDGSWEMFGLDAQGKVVPTARWTDVITLGAPLAHEATRVYAKATDVMDFGGGAKPMEVSFIEGFAVEPDGKLGRRFFEFGGARTELVQLGEATWVFENPVGERDLRGMGLDPAKVRAAHSTTTKHVTGEAGAQTEWITRVTTVVTDGAIPGGPVFQFVSMRGHHTRRH